jgi:hypothetical protein
MMSWWTAFAWGTLLVAITLGVLIAGYYLISAAAAWQTSATQVSDVDYREGVLQIAKEMQKTIRVVR